MQKPQIQKGINLLIMGVVLLCLAFFNSCSSNTGTGTNETETPGAGINGTGANGNVVENSYPPIPANCALPMGERCPAGYVLDIFCTVQLIPLNESCSSRSNDKHIEFPITDNFKLCTFRCFKSIGPGKFDFDRNDFKPANCALPIGEQCPAGYKTTSPGGCVTKQVPLNVLCSTVGLGDVYTKFTATDNVKLCTSKCIKQ